MTIQSRIGDFFTLPQWLPTTVGSTETIGSDTCTQAPRRLTPTQHAALLAPFEAAMERTYFACERHNTASPASLKTADFTYASGGSIPYAAFVYQPTNRIVSDRFLSFYDNMTHCVDAVKNLRFAFDSPVSTEHFDNYALWSSTSPVFVNASGVEDLFAFSWTGNIPAEDWAHAFVTIDGRCPVEQLFPIELCLGKNTLENEWRTLVPTFDDQPYWYCFDPTNALADTTHRLIVERFSALNVTLAGLNRTYHFGEYFPLVSTRTNYTTIAEMDGGTATVMWQYDFNLSQIITSAVPVPASWSDFSANTAQYRQKPYALYNSLSWRYGNYSHGSEFRAGTTDATPVETIALDTSAIEQFVYNEGLSGDFTLEYFGAGIDLPHWSVMLPVIVTDAYGEHFETHYMALHTDSGSVQVRLSAHGERKYSKIEPETDDEQKGCHPGTLGWTTGRVSSATVLTMLSLARVASWNDDPDYHPIDCYNYGQNLPVELSLRRDAVTSLADFETLFESTIPSDLKTDVLTDSGISPTIVDDLGITQPELTNAMTYAPAVSLSGNLTVAPLMPGWTLVLKVWAQYPQVWIQEVKLRNPEGEEETATLPINWAQLRLSLSGSSIGGNPWPVLNEQSADCVAKSCVDVKWNWKTLNS